MTKIVVAGQLLAQPVRAFFSSPSTASRHQTFHGDPLADLPAPDAGVPRHPAVLWSPLAWLTLSSATASARVTQVVGVQNKGWVSQRAAPR